MTEALGGKALDDFQAPDERKIDYACLNGLLAIEMKSLEEDGSERIGNLTDELSKRSDWPMFLGSAPMESFLKHLADPEDARLRFLDRVGRGIVSPLRSANKQLAAHEVAFPRKNLVRIMLLINEDHEVYDPATVIYIIRHALSRRRDDKPHYEHVDGVIFMTERHATKVNNKIAFPVVFVESPVAAPSPWKEQVIDRFLDGWARWNRHPIYQATTETEFATIDHIPDTAPRHERWRTDYKRNPYMKDFSKEQIREAFDEVMFITEVTMMKGAPINMPMEGTMANMERFTHVMLEMGWRGIPATEFQHSPERILAAGRRMNAAKHVLDWLQEFEEKHARKRQQA